MTEISLVVPSLGASAPVPTKDELRQAMKGNFVDVLKARLKVVEATDEVDWAQKERNHTFFTCALERFYGLSENDASYTVYGDPRSSQEAPVCVMCEAYGRNEVPTSDEFDEQLLAQAQRLVDVYQIGESWNREDGDDTRPAFFQKLAARLLGLPFLEPEFLEEDMTPVGRWEWAPKAN